MKKVRKIAIIIFLSCLFIIFIVKIVNRIQENRATKAEAQRIEEAQKVQYPKSQNYGYTGPTRVDTSGTIQPGCVKVIYIPLGWMISMGDGPFDLDKEYWENGTSIKKYTLTNNTNKPVDYFAAYRHL